MTSAMFGNVTSSAGGLLTSLGRVTITGPIHYYGWFAIKFCSDCEC